MDKDAVASSADLPGPDVGPLWSLVAAFATAVEAHLGRWLTETHGLGLSEYRALAVLAQAPNQALPLHELGVRIGLQRSSVTRLLERLEAKALMHRQRFPDHGRSVYAVLTPDGENLLRESAQAYEAKLQELMCGRSPEAPPVDRGRLAGAFQTLSRFLA
jgi:DNA-binding MarR family transcriptional regulator